MANNRGVMNETQVNPHPTNCTCLWCEQQRIHNYYYSRNQPKKDHVLLWILGTVLVALIILLTVAAFIDPSVNLPVISQVVCSLKGDTWYGGGILGQPGCYSHF